MGLPEKIEVCRSIIRKLTHDEIEELREKGFKVIEKKNSTLICWELVLGD